MIGSTAHQGSETKLTPSPPANMDFYADPMDTGLFSPRH